MTIGVFCPAGFTFAYNARLFFLTYHPETDIGTWLALAAIVGGAAGVFCGGAMSDALLKRLASPAEASKGAKARLWVLAGSMFVASPFAVGVLKLDPPYSFASLFAYYFFGW